MKQGYDGPVSDGPPVDQGMQRVVRWEDLSDLIRQKRLRERLTLEEAARQSGISAATLSRWERQWEPRKPASGRPRDQKVQPEPDTRTLAAITRWLGVPIDRVASVDPTSGEGCVHHRHGASTPDVIEAHLRADRNLTPETAEALAGLFRATYEQFSRPRDPATGREGAATEPPRKGDTGVDGVSTSDTSGLGSLQSLQRAEEAE
jgi:hypothetical protein